jgi:CDP-diacylglycerol---glycerol-3-phosphate 3-phosphatidyltransferase
MSSPNRSPANGAGTRPAKPILSDAARDRLIESRLTPNAISMVGLLGNLIAVGFVFAGWWIPAGVAFVLGSAMDLLDGKYSRMSGKATLFGAFLDSSLDRVEEGLVLAAIAWQLSRAGDDWAAMAVVLAVLGSLMVSYTRARAEALGIECKVGIATRAVRVVIISIGLFLADITISGHELAILKASVYVLAALSLFTMLQRIWHVYKQSKILDAASRRLEIDPS